MTTDEFPSPKYFYSLVRRCPEGVREGTLDCDDINARGSPPGDKTRDVQSKFSGGDPLSPKEEGTRSKGTKGRDGVWSSLCAVPFVRR